MVKGESVLVTGGRGFIGRHLTNLLTKEEFQIHVLDVKHPNEDIMNNFKGRVFNGDIRDTQLIKKVFDEDVKLIVHLASFISVDESLYRPYEYIDNNVMGTLNLLELSRLYDVEFFVYVSSASVYGDPVYLPVDEGHPTRPLSVYGYSKLLAEYLVKMYHELYGLKYAIFRLFNVYGPGQSMEYAGVITKFIDRVSRGLPPIIYGDGQQTRDFIHVTDVCRAIYQVLDRRVVGTFNIGSGRATRILDLAHMIIKLMNVDLEPIHREPRAGDIKHSYADISKARNILGFKPIIDLEKGLKNLIQHVNER